MSTIDLYQVLKQIPDVTDEQAKNAADSATQSDLSERLARVETAVKISLGLHSLQVAMLAIVLAHVLS